MVNVRESASCKSLFYLTNLPKIVANIVTNLITNLVIVTSLISNLNVLTLYYHHAKVTIFFKIQSFLEIS